MQNISVYPGSIIGLKRLLFEIKPQSIFLVTGRESFVKCGAKDKLHWLESQYKVIHFTNFQTNPSMIDVIRGVQIFNNEECDLFLSVGGGSSIDIAKLINYYRNTPINNINSNNIYISDFSPIKHVCIPSTAGSGSESTHFAVVYEDNEKFSVAHKELIPNYVIIDPELHYSQTPYQKAVSGIDALAQAIESFWSINSNEESLIYSDIALKLIWQNLYSVVNGTDINSHLMLSIGANLAGKAINIAKTTAPHALAYGFTKYAGLPHGHAVALSLPYFMNINSNINISNCNDYRGVNHVKTILNRINSVIDSNESLNLFLKKINIETNFNKLNISKDIVKTVINNINNERLANNPVKIEKSDIINLFNSNNN